MRKNTSFIFIFMNEYARCIHSQSGKNGKKIHLKISENGDNCYYP